MRNIKTIIDSSEYDTENKEHLLICCGDLFDRWTENFDVLRFFERIERKVMIKGNHEERLLEILNTGRLGQHDFMNGTIETIQEFFGKYSVMSLLDPVDFSGKTGMVDRLCDLLGEMRDFYETENYVFVHGWIPCLTLLESRNRVRYIYQGDWRDANKERWDEARWTNGMYAAECGAIEPNKTIVCGHFHSSYGHSLLEGKCSEFGKDADFSPYYAKGIIAIDACTAHSGKINCIVIEDDESVEFVGRKILKEHKKVFEELAKNE